MNFPDILFVSGTDTDIGKSVISSMLVLGLKAGYWKPVQSGVTPCTDTQFVKKTTGLNSDYFYRETYLLNEPLSPHASAKIDDVHINMKNFNLPQFSQKKLVVEGAGGLLVPMNDKEMIIDLISYLKLPILLVARSGLGTLNHTLLSIEAIRKRGLELFGVVLNGEPNPSNEEAIVTYGAINKLFRVPIMPDLKPDTLQSQFLKSFLTNAS